MIDPLSWISNGAQSLVDLYGVAHNYKAQLETNKSNERNVAATNASNERMVAATNAANVEQANLAYERSKPITQVANMMDAGMSKSAALQSLSGGGVYTPPALQTATAQPFIANAPQLDYKGISNAIDRLGNMPANQVQLDIQREQLQALRDESVNRANEERRKQERFDYETWLNRYNRNTADLLDGVSSKVVQRAAEKDYDLSSAKSVQSIMRDLGLEKDSDYQKMPHLARVDLFNAIKSQNEQRILQEKHDSEMRLSALDESIKKSNLMQLAEDYKNSVKEHKTQDKERIVREGRATLEHILIQNNINQEEFLNSVRFDSDGKPNLVGRTKSYLKEAWSLIGSILPLDYLGDILRGLIKIG